MDARFVARVTADDARLVRLATCASRATRRPRARARALDGADAAQALERDRIVAWIDRYPADAHRRERLEGHLTASALVVDPARGQALLTHHRKLGRWLQLGGHCDGDANLARTALREAIEESGIEDLRVDPTPIDVDVHAIPERGAEPRHLHLDTRFLVVAPAGALESAGEESLAAALVRPGRARAGADRRFGPPPVPAGFPRA
jgi:ADP-ribose pyrophosphatase YjhB (NUDIX family)